MRLFRAANAAWAWARLLGGGADVESKDIYNWANFISFTAGARVSLAALLGRADRRR